MATLAGTCVRTVASSGLFSVTCDSRSKCSAKADLLPSVPHSRSIQVQQLRLERNGSFAIVPALNRRTPRLASICRRAGAPGDDDEEMKRDSGVKGEFNDTVEQIEKALGKSFGGTLWFAILLVCVTVFGGGYVYLIYNYADFSDIPILNGPKGLQ